MKLTKNEFQVLEFLESSDGKVSQRKISSSLKISLGTVNKLVSSMALKNYLIYNNNDGIKITEEGLNQLEPYRVKRAILLAAGFGSRMRPVTLNTPKPLVRVHGKRIIDSILDALTMAGIDEVYVVCGYLAEQFSVLKDKYPNITILNNTLYNETNNISSAYLVRDKFKSAYVMEADLLIHNPKIIKKYNYSSNYTARYVEETNDWCFKMKNGYINSLQIGGKDCYHTYCIAYFDNEDGIKMEKDLESAFSLPGAREKVWDYVALDYFKEHYKISVREVDKSDIDEIDTFNELKMIDKTYDV